MKSVDCQVFLKSSKKTVVVIKWVEQLLWWCSFLPINLWLSLRIFIVRRCCRLTSSRCFFLHGFEIQSLHAYVEARTPVANISDDGLSLLDFKSMIEDPFGVLRSWNDSLHFCRWEGVTCGRRHSRVTILHLSHKSLVGSLSPSLGNLTFLRYIYLQNNTFNGRIPEEIGRLSRLEALFLHNNSLNGEIPRNLSRCSKLLFLYLGYNNLVGDFPIEIFGISGLQSLTFHRNKISGEIPSAIANLTSLEVLSIADNLLGGGIPSSIGSLMKLKQLGIGGNAFLGTLPSSIYNLSLLEVLSMAKNRLHGSLPPDMAHSFPELRYFQIGNNNFTGLVPRSFSNASHIVYFELTDNSFFGKVSVDFGGAKNLSALLLEGNHLGNGDPDELNFISSLANCSKLSRLSVFDNSFRGILPGSLANLSSYLRVFVIAQNQLFGEIPSGIGNLAGLNVLGLQFNDLTGGLPSEIGRLLNLRYLSTASNGLSGELPSSIGNLTKLITLDLRVNNFHGGIPHNIENCHDLSFLSLRKNNLSGSFPEQVFDFPNLGNMLDLSENKFSGELSAEIGGLKKLTTLLLSSNQLSGNIPSQLGDCISLEYLGMQGNYFHGSIPPTFRSLRGLRQLDLSNNNLSGPVPDFLSTFLLTYLNLSFNNFEGEVPTNGVFSNASAISLTGNEKLCGGITALNLPNCSHEASKKPKLTKLLKIILSICICLFGLVAISFFVLCLVLKKKRKKAEASKLEDPLFLEVSYSDLLKATNNFSSINLIGSGYFSSIYKGFLEKIGESVAIKVLNLERHGALRSFASECEALRNIRHRNLLKTITSCSSADYHGNDFKALVYEFMANGSLDSWLHVSSSPGRERGDLNFLQRVSIAIDVATGLDYLHKHCHIQIVHCDLKPSNILLDEDMTAHIGDFGLTKLLPELTNFTENSSIEIRGTIGYAAPEYGLGSEVSAQGDIYSYGILLLEMITRKKPTDEMFVDGLDLHAYAGRALSHQVLDIVDPCLLPSKESEKTKTINSLVSLIKLGVTCSSKSPRERIDAKSICHELRIVRNSLLEPNKT